MIDSVIYFDNAATTPMSLDVFERMKVACIDKFGNPSSTHPAGKESRLLVQRSRQKISSLIGCDEDELLFTSGGTESNNLALIGVFHQMREQNKNHIVCSSIEHKSVLETISKLRESGAKVSFVPCDKNGYVSATAVLNAIRKDTGLVSVGLVNGETGVIQPIQKIAKSLTERRVVFHCDAVQALGKIAFNCHLIGADIMSFSGHKLHGPKGVGALYIKHGTHIKPLIFGGAQERGQRAGTENVAGIVGFEVALEKILSDHERHSNHVLKLKNKLKKRLREIKGVIINSDVNKASPYILNVSFNAVNGALLHKMLAERGICVSSGSACNSESQIPSPVLLSMGISKPLAQSSVRFSFSYLNTKDEVNYVIEQCFYIMRVLQNFENA